MLLRLLIVLTVVPLVELLILLRLAERFSWGATIALVLITGLLGASLARREGLKTLRKIQADLAAGSAPTDALVEGALILVAGLVLVTPGVVTDLIGFALLFAPLRRWARRRLAEAFRRRVFVVGSNAPGTNAAGEARHDSFIDVTASSKKAETHANGTAKTE